MIGNIGNMDLQIVNEINTLINQHHDNSLISNIENLNNLLIQRYGFNLNADLAVEYLDYCLNNKTVDEIRKCRKILQAFFAKVYNAQKAEQLKRNIRNPRDEVINKILTKNYFNNLFEAAKEGGTTFFDKIKDIHKKQQEEIDNILGNLEVIRKDAIEQSKIAKRNFEEFFLQKNNNPKIKLIISDGIELDENKTNEIFQNKNNQSKKLFLNEVKKATYNCMFDTRADDNVKYAINNYYGGKLNVNDAIEAMDTVINGIKEIHLSAYGDIKNVLKRSKIFKAIYDYIQKKDKKIFLNALSQRYYFHILKQCGDYYVTNSFFSDCSMHHNHIRESSSKMAMDNNGVFYHKTSAFSTLPQGQNNHTTRVFLQQRNFTPHVVANNNVILDKTNLKPNDCIKK